GRSPLDPMPPMCRNLNTIARPHRDRLVVSLELQLRFALQNHDPLGLVLIVPEALGRGVARRHNPLDAHMPALRKHVDLFLGKRRRRLGEEVSDGEFFHGLIFPSSSLFSLRLLRLCGVKKEHRRDTKDAEELRCRGSRILRCSVVESYFMRIEGDDDIEDEGEDEEKRVDCARRDWSASWRGAPHPEPNLSPSPARVAEGELLRF